MTDPRPHNDHPRHPRFYRAALDHLPIGVLVLNTDGVLTYANEYLSRISGWRVADGVGRNMLEFIHPDDHEYVIESFGNVTSAPESDHSLDATPWSPVRFRGLKADGSSMPVEVTGVSGLGDPSVGGVIYTVRTYRDDELLTDIFAGAASHQPIEQGCPPLVERLALPPARLEAAVFEQRANGSVRCVVASDDALRELPASTTDRVPWAGLVTQPARVDYDTLLPEALAVLDRAGFRACFHAGAHAPDHEVTLRLIACVRDDPRFYDGLLSQIGQARELLSIIAAKAHNDRVIANHATRDDLTGLPNRLGLGHRFERVGSTTDDCAVMFVDIDNFKQINDAHGHAAGDRVLSAVADRLVRTIRPDDFVSRIGGDEFAILLSDGEGRLGPETIRMVAERVVAILAEPVSFNGIAIPLAASVGVARAGVDRDFDQLMDRADGAMYRAKRAGGGRHHVDSSAA